MGVTSEAGSSYLFGAPDFNLMFLVSMQWPIETGQKDKQLPTKLYTENLFF
jgi:hypothetical protein